MSRVEHAMITARLYKRNNKTLQSCLKQLAFRVDSAATLKIELEQRLEHLKQVEVELKELDWDE